MMSRDPFQIKLFYSSLKDLFPRQNLWMKGCYCKHGFLRLKIFSLIPAEECRENLGNAVYVWEI